MRYHDIAAGRFRSPSTHPILLRLCIDPANWHELQRLDEGNPGTVIVGHEEPLGGRMIVNIGCASHEVRRRLEDEWWG